MQGLYQDKTLTATNNTRAGVYDELVKIVRLNNLLTVAVLKKYTSTNKLLNALHTLLSIVHFSGSMLLQLGATHMHSHTHALSTGSVCN